MGDKVKTEMSIEEIKRKAYSWWYGEYNFKEADEWIAPYLKIEELEPGKSWLKIAREALGITQRQLAKHHLTLHMPGLREAKLRGQ